MKKSIKLLPPASAKINFIHFETSASEDATKCFNTNHSLPITDLSEDEAEEFGELIKQTFLNHYHEQTRIGHKPSPRN